MKSTMIALALCAATIAHAQAQQLPAQQWIPNCIGSLETQDGRRAFTELGQTPPSHEQNVKYCVEEYNKGKAPSQRIHSWDGWKDNYKQ